MEAAEEQQGALNRLIEDIQSILDSWNERSPTQLASAISDASLSMIVDVLSEVEIPENADVFTAIATTLLPRYASEDGDVEEFRSEIWTMAQDSSLPGWTLRSLMQAIFDIAQQQPRRHPSYMTYRMIGAMTAEVLHELGNNVTPYTPRRKRRRAAVSLARTADLPELSSLTLQPLDEKPVARGRTGTLTGLPNSIHLPTQYRPPEWIVNWDELPEDPHLRQTLLEKLPGVYALLETWEEQQTPFALAAELRKEEIPTLLQISGALLPHTQQVEYLRYLSLLLHLKLLQDPLPQLNEHLRQLFSEPDERVEPLLNAIAYYLYCSSHSFYGIQEQALKRLDIRNGYFYHLVLEEWSKNKRLRSFMRTWLSRKEQSAVKLLSSFDWEYIFYILNQGWARSVIRDVYGIFHGSSAFANQIVLPDTSKGFGNLRASSGVSFLATRQISDLLHKQRRSANSGDDNARYQQFESFVTERFRKDVLRKEQRPTLNAPTLKRLERYVNSLWTRAQQQGVELQVASRLGTREILQAFAYLRPERLDWLGYELTRLWLSEAPDAETIEIVLAGLFAAILDGTERVLSHRRKVSDVLHFLLYSVMNAVLDHAVRAKLPTDWVRDLPQRMQVLMEAQKPALHPLYERHFMVQQL